MPDTDTRADHIAWVKERALAELDADPSYMGVANALASVGSDLTKHADTADHPAILLGTQLAMAGHLDTHQQARDFITGIQ